MYCERDRVQSFRASRVLSVCDDAFEELGPVRIRGTGGGPPKSIVFAKSCIVSQRGPRELEVQEHLPTTVAKRGFVVGAAGSGYLRLTVRLDRKASVKDPLTLLSSSRTRLLPRWRAR